MEVKHIGIAYKAGNAIFEILDPEYFSTALTILGKSETVEEAIQSLNNEKLKVKIYIVGVSDEVSKPLSVIEKYVTKKRLTSDLFKLSARGNSGILRYPLWMGNELEIEVDSKGFDIVIRDCERNIQTELIYKNSDTLWDIVKSLVNCYYTYPYRTGKN